MPLTDMQIRKICPTDRVTQYTDDRGLYLEVHPSGSKLWRYKYLYMGKQKRLALGRYPQVGLSEARRRRDDARRQLETGVDPLAEASRVFRRRFHLSHATISRAWLQDLSVEEMPPYHGAKPCLLITADRWEDGAWLSKLIALTARALPATKPRKRS